MRLLRLTPWRRAPMLLVRRPGVAMVLFAAALVAALPAAGAPLFLSSSEHATLHRQVDQTCLWQVGGQFTGPFAPPNPQFTPGIPLGPDSVVGAERFHQRIEAVAAHPVAGLTGPVSAGYGDLNATLVDRELPWPDLTGIRLLTREGFEDQVEVLAGPAGPGLWLPHEHAEQQGIEVGDELELTPRRVEAGTWEPPPARESVVMDQDAVVAPPPPAPEPVTVRVAAIYRDLRTLPSAEITDWCGVEVGYIGTVEERSSADTAILPMVLTDQETLLAVGEQTRIQAQQVIELAVIDPRLTAPEAARLAAELEALRATMFREYPDLFSTSVSSDRSEFHSFLDRYQRRAELVRTGLLPPVLPITAAGTLVGLAVAAAAAVFWGQRRRRELTLLAAHGVGARGLGLKGVVEALPAVLAGTVAGWAAAWGLVAAVGPSPVLAPGALPAAAATAAVVGLVALLLIGGLATGQGRALTDAQPVTHRVGWWRRVPWELSLIAAAPAAWWLLRSDQVADTEAGGVGTVAHVPAGLLVTPILIIAGVSIFAGRLAAIRLGRHGLDRLPRRPAQLLAWRRSVRAAVATAILAGATAVPVAMATFGATATDSIRTTADAKLQFGLGSDTVVAYPRATARERDDLPPPPPIPASLTGRSTEVLRLDQQRLGGLIVDVLAVDPHTFTSGAYWDNRIPGPSLTHAVEQLSAGAEVTVVTSRRFAPGPQVLTIRDEDIPVEVVATRPLPGSQAAYPMVMIHRDVVERLSERSRNSFTPQWWIAGDPAETAAAVTAADLPLTRMVSIDDHRVGAVYEPVTYTFQYLIALSIFTGLIGAVGLLLYLESRTANHRRGYVMLRRLGLKPRTHRRALLLEIATPVLCGLAAGTLGAAAIGFALQPGFDLNPRRFPGALLDLPFAIAMVICVTTVVIAVGASVLTHARISRANPAEVLRAD